MKIGKFEMGRKGVMWIWLTVLATIFVVALVYIVFNQVLYSSFGVYTFVNTSLSTSPTNTTSAQQAMTVMKTIWDYWPLIAIFGIIVWGFARSQKKEHETYYY